MSATGPYHCGGSPCGVRVVCAAAVAAVLGGCLAACGSAGSTEPPPFSKIGFIGGLTPGVGFVGGGRGHHDAGPYPPDGGQGHENDDSGAAGDGGSGQDATGTSSSSGGSSSGSSGASGSGGSSGGGDGGDGDRAWA